ncbi:hypothetical protein [Magnetospirillum moscoviense]|nr:hypothetical protein [Magnetospirillum moscoviense]
MTEETSRIIFRSVVVFLLIVIAINTRPHNVVYDPSAYVELVKMNVTLEKMLLASKGDEVR